MQQNIFQGISTRAQQMIWGRSRLKNVFFYVNPTINTVV